jgi:5-methylcytosine-specific restriction protein A
MKGISSGTLLLFSYQTECMFIARAAGEIVATGNAHSPGYIPLDMASLRPVSGSLRDFQNALHENKLTAVNIVQSRNWPELPPDCEDFALNYFKTAQADPKHIREAKARLRDVMLELFSRAGEETGYWGRYYLRDVRNKGGFETAREMLKPRKANAEFHKGFKALLDSGRADELSVEAIVLRDEFRSLFSPVEIAEAQRRLGAVIRQTPIPPDSNYADEVPDRTDYHEGAVKKVTVNAYERDPKARKACLNEHGYDCSVCGLNFEQRYGRIGRGFIHVHHKKPLASKGGSYVVNPKKDLTPVCPNCHAMLHSSTPPMTVQQLKRILK